MGVVVSLDPGIRACGIAVWRGEQLARADLVKNPVTKGLDGHAMQSMVSAITHWLGAEESVSTAVVEFPKVYQRTRSKGDPNDLTVLAGVSMGFACAVRPGVVLRVFPSDWKGQMPEEATTARVRTRLDLFEAQCLKNAEERAKSLAHNVVDAVGVGLWALGRFDRRRSVPR